MITSLLNLQTIQQYLPQSLDITVLPTVASTNEYLKNIVSDARKMAICLAEEQTAGKGRLGRNWFSPFGVNLYLSCGWYIPEPVHTLSGFSLVVGIAICQVLKECGIKDGIKIKWPNDILFQGEKLAGILIEVSAKTPGYLQVIVGIGLNINNFVVGTANNQIPIEQPWTTLQNILGYPQDRNKLAALIIQALIENKQFFLRHGLQLFLEEWYPYDFFLHREIALLQDDQDIFGVGMGINQQGRLLIKLADGKINSYSTGEITIKK